MRAIDVHAHWGNLPVPMRDTTLSELLRVLDANSIERIVVSSIEAICYDMASGNRSVAEVVAQSSRVFGYIFLNPNRLTDSFEEIERYALNPRFIGVKMYSGAYIGQPLNCPGHKRFLERVAAKFPRLVILFHCGENDPNNFANIRELAREFQTLKFIMGHMGSALWPQALTAARDQKNLFAEVSAPLPARTRTEDAVKALGADRVLFGSDYPIINPAYTLGAVLGADISDEQRRQILYQNALRLLPFPRS
jgi:predicted TIM-barrel fold metal-dependent hydrolase